MQTKRRKEILNKYLHQGYCILFVLYLLASYQSKKYLINASTQEERNFKTLSLE